MPSPSASGRSLGAAPSTLTLLLAIAAAGCGGKGVGGHCSDLAACGGNPVGVWQIDSVCEFNEPRQPLLTVPVPSAYSSPQTPALAGAAPSPTTSGDWCSGLIYLPPAAATSGTVGNVQFFAKPLAFVKGNVAFLADSSYTINVFGASPEVTHFSRSCLNAYGANPSCLDLQTGLNAQPLVNYVELTCAAGAENGCDCTYKLAETSGDIGVWAATGGTLVEYPNSGAKPQAVDFCVQDNNMTLSGRGGAHLSASSGRRTMSLTKCPDSGCPDDPNSGTL